MLISSIGIFSILCLIVILFMNLSPEFGDTLNAKQKLSLENEPNYQNGKFINPEKIEMDYSFSNILKMLGEVLKSNPERQPKKNIEVQKLEPEVISEKNRSLERITWFGHSTFLLEIEGKKLLIDPIFSDYAAPHPLFGKKRYNKEMPISIENLPPIDAVFISHDHYDHLDYPTIKKLKSKVTNFYVPLGVGNHLISWGIEKQKIQEMNWWDSSKLGDLKIDFVPSRHSSGRAIMDQSATLWGGWVFRGNSKKIYYSGDGGYGKHFNEIGKKFGEFDLGIIECGQYNKLWADVHMMPEETAKAAKDINAKILLPVHWGALTLASHSWTDPIERLKKVLNTEINLATPEIGQLLDLNTKKIPQSKWWDKYK